jgi:hypothetical protein
LKQIVDLYEIWEGGHIIEVELYTILCNPVASTILEYQTFRLLRWVQNLHQSVWDHDILCADSLQSANNFQQDRFCEKTQKYECEWCLKIKIHILFYGDISLTIALRQTKFGTSKDHGYNLRVLFESVFCLTKLWQW